MLVEAKDWMTTGERKAAMVGAALLRLAVLCAAFVAPMATPVAVPR